MARTPVKKATTKKSIAGKKAKGKAPEKKVVTKKKATKKVQPSKTVASKKAGNKVSLNAVLVINDAKALYSELSEHIMAKKRVSIDASAVEMIDTAIFQILLAFSRKAQLQNIAVTWIKPSKEFLSRSETLNLSAMLGLNEAQG